MLSLRLAGNFKPKGITMKDFQWPEDTISHFKELKDDLPESKFIMAVEDHVARMHFKTAEIAEEMFQDLINKVNS